MLVSVFFKDRADCERFVDITSQIDGRIELYSRDNRKNVYSGKSFMGVLSAAKEPNLYCIADLDIEDKISNFISKN